MRLHDKRTCRNPHNGPPDALRTYRPFISRSLTVSGARSHTCELRSAPFSFSFHSQRPSTQKRRIGIITRAVACSAAARHTATAPRCFLCISHSCVLALLILIVILNHDWQDWSRYAHARAHASTLTREGASASHAIPVPSCTPCVSHMAVLEWKLRKRWKHC